MPAGVGENLLTTLFADVHYFFGDPAAKPQHHRFDRSSYVYLFHNEAENRAKLEIANHAGTPDQDAFSGYLSMANIKYSYKQPALFTIVIDGAAVQGHDQWHLPSYDEKNENKYLYKISSIDLYLWTEMDASSFLGHLKSVVPSEKLEIKDTPSNLQNVSEHRDSMSPVVQQLEKTAINPAFTPERHESTTSAHSLPGSPPVASPQPVTMGYNPAAPAAPEPIAHREKTPPPVDAETGTGLGNAAMYDAIPQQQYGNVPNMFPSSNQPGQQAYFSGPPQQQQHQQIRNPSLTSFPGPPQGTPPGSQNLHSGSLPPPPPPPPTGSGPSPLQQASSFAPPPTQPSQTTQPTSPPPNQQSFGRQPSFGAPIQQHASYPQYQQTPSFGPHAVSSPGMPGTQQPPPPPPPAPSSYTPGQQGQQQAFGYSGYNYGAPQQAQGYGQGGGYSGDIHSQAYRPTAEESASQGRPPSQQRPNSESRQRLEDRVKGVEAGVGKYLKKFDKLW